MHYQGMAKHFEAAEAGKLRLRCRDTETYVGRIGKQMDTLASLDGVVSYLLETNPDAAAPLQSIKRLIHLRLDKEHAPSSKA